MRNITLLTAVFVLGFTAPAIADPSSNVAFDAETRALLKSADPAKGKAIAEKRKCAKCHGDMGLVDDPEDVNLAGQVASYTFKQLRDYKDEKRDNRSMKRATKKLTQEDMAHLAVWFESLPAAEPMKKASDETLQLVFKGDPKRMLKPCASCHGKNGEGGMHDSAKLAGTTRGYFIETMTAFKEGDRENDIYSRMRTVAQKLTEKEIAALADYYSTHIPE